MTETTSSPIDKLLPPQDKLLLPQPKHHFSIIIVLGLIVCAVVITWILYTFTTKSLSEKQIPIPVVTQLPKQKIGISENWTIYQSNFGYSLQHPSSWIEHNSDWQQYGKSYTVHQNDEVVISFTEPESTGSANLLKGLLVTLKKPKPNPQGLPIKKWYKSNFPAFSFVRQEDIIVDNVNSLQAISVVDTKAITIFIPDNTQVIQITYQPIGEVNESSSYDYEGIFYQILSTFKFDNF